MNFLAHAYLSFGHPQILVGNIISDFVKGAKKEGYEKDIRQGITLHREIDSYTDLHPETKKAGRFFQQAYRLYSGPITDIVFDHYVARLIETEGKGRLSQFSGDVYRVLEEHIEKLPPNFVSILYYMKRDDWLANYLNREGIERSLKGLARRATYLEDSSEAFRLFNQHYDELEKHFSAFFPDVKSYAKHRFEQLIY